VVTGVVNSWYTLGSVPAFFGTGYGQLLGTKLLLFFAMVSLAAINRWRWTPRITPDAPDAAVTALARLRRNAVIEAALGFAVLGLVGVLGVTVPATHVQPLWPFPVTLEWSAVADPRRMGVAALIVAIAAGAVVALGMRARRGEMTASGFAAVAGVALVSIWLFSAPAHPTTYYESPVRYNVASIARGAPLYTEYCSGCHGRFGEGDGPAAAALGVRPPYLTPHLAHHREGDIFWWIEHGIANTRMPGFGERMSEEQVWDLLNYLRAMANADLARRLDTSVQPFRAVTAPDFTFQIDRNAQETLAQERGRHIVLLMFYSSPPPLERLRALSERKSRFDRLGLRIVAVPMKESDAIRPGTRGIDASMLAEPDPNMVSVFAMFTRQMYAPPVMPRHAEFMIDRAGYLRGRWLAGQGWSTSSETLHQASALAFERPRPPAPARHGH
jgi:putative copper resistance protein D